MDAAETVNHEEHAGQASLSERDRDILEFERQ
jgi:hypothetical protein